MYKWELYLDAWSVAIVALRSLVFFMPDPATFSRLTFTMQHQIGSLLFS